MSVNDNLKAAAKFFELPEFPNGKALLLKAATTSSKKPKPDTLAARLGARVKKVFIDREWVRQYNAVCGFKDDEISLTAPQVVASPLHMYLLSRPEHPMPMLGMVHLHNSIEQIHALEFGVPYDHFPAGVYNPPANPAPIPFVSGFSFASPTPGTAINSSNIPAVLNPLNGNLTFNSFTIGNYALKIVVKAYRAGVLISETEREMQLVLQPCNSSNFPPIIAPPFAAGTSYELTVNAGDLIDVPLLITDPDTQSNGSPQNITLEAQLPCTIGPCPSLSVALPFTATSQIQTQFTWQTTCDHLLDGQGQVAGLEAKGGVGLHQLVEGQGALVELGAAGTGQEGQEEGADKRGDI